MTTYILHGGVPSGTTHWLADLSFWPEVAQRLRPGARILCIYAANDPSRWPTDFQREQARMAEVMGNVELELGSVTTEQLAAQVAEASVVYLRGGHSNELVKSTLMRLANLPQLLQGKIVAGSSAGAYALSRYYCSRHGELGTGLGVVPCKVLAHFTPERQADLDKLREYGEDLPVYTLAEGEYSIIEE